MVGTRAFYYNAELRFPLIDALVTPVVGFGGIRGLLFFNLGSAWSPEFDEDVGLFTDGRFGPNGRASLGFGININFFIPLHVDYSYKGFNRDDPRTSSDEDESGVDFWVGFDF
jgi:outer membrane protein assembly factor BamA